MADLNAYFKSIIDQDRESVVICDLNHIIIYMNVYTYHNAKHDRDVYMVALRDASGTLIGYYEKHDSRKAETMKQYDLF